jgi:cell wall assembly regulator SMI1
MANEQDKERMRLSIERISRWMNAHDAPLLVSNLAPGASAEELARTESELGVALPSDLGALWSLHDGQREEQNGFVESYDLLSIRGALAQREDVLSAIEFARESPDWWKDSGGTSEELTSNHWLPFAGRDSDSLVVHGVSGRVFQVPHDDSPKLIAASLGEWFQRYADRVEADDYAVEEGFGDYYLELRDREAERREQERARRASEQERLRRETPLLDQLHQAIERQDAERCTEVLKDALDRDDKASFDASVARLFADDLDAKFLAGALRPLLNAVTLTPDQWVDVAVGGALLGNHAIRDVAVSRADGFSAAGSKRLETTLSNAPPEDRSALEQVVQKLRAKRTSDAPSHGGGGSWLSRLFKKRPPSG